MNKSKIDWCEYKSHTRNPVIVKTGYVWVWCPEHPNAKKSKKNKGGYIQEHRLVMSNHLKRPLNENEHIHHINGNKKDNRIENLQLMSNSEHRKWHMSELTYEERAKNAKGLIKYAESRKIKRKFVFCDCGCGQQFETPDNKGRFHRFIRGHNTKGTHWVWGRRIENE